MYVGQMVEYYETAVATPQPAVVLYVNSAGNRVNVQVFIDEQHADVEWFDGDEMARGVAYRQAAQVFAPNDAITDAPAVRAINLPT